MTVELVVLPHIDRRSKKWILLALMVTMALAAVDITIVATSIPEIVADLSGLQFVSWFALSRLPRNREHQIFYR